MLLKTIKLSGLKHFTLSNIQTIEVDFTAPLQLVLGTNGCGKSSIMAQLTPMPATPQDYYEGQGAAAASYGPPPPGYDYDPYAMREEEGGGTSQWLMIGCVGLLLLCCCLTVVAGVAIDCFVLWDDIPVLSNILEALAIPVNTSDPSCITF